jgi:hypothetical protein
LCNRCAVGFVFGAGAGVGVGRVAVAGACSEDDVFGVVVPTDGVATLGDVVTGCDC